MPEPAIQQAAVSERNLYSNGSARSPPLLYRYILIYLEIFVKSFYLILSESYLIILEPGQMLVGKNQPSPEQAAAVVDKAVICGPEHIHVYL